MGQSKGDNPLLGDFELKLTRFKNIDQVLPRFQEEAFLKLNLHEKSNQVSEVLLELIEEEKETNFLLRAITEYITCIKDQKILENYTFSSFELWLNQFSKLSFDENYRITR